MVHLLLRSGISGTAPVGPQNCEILASLLKTWLWRDFQICKKIGTRIGSRIGPRAKPAPRIGPRIGAVTDGRGGRAEKSVLGRILKTDLGVSEFVEIIGELDEY